MENETKVALESLSQIAGGLGSCLKATRKKGASKTEVYENLMKAASYFKIGSDIRNELESQARNLL